MKTVNYSDEITANAGGFCVGHRGVSHQAESERLLPSDDSGQQIRWGSAGHLLALANPAISCQRTSSSNTVGIGVNCDGSSAGQSIGFLIRSGRIRPSYPESSGVIIRPTPSRLRRDQLILSHPEDAGISKSGDNKGATKPP